MALKSIRARLTILYVGSFLVLSAAAFGLTELASRLFFARVIDRTLTRQAHRLVSGLESCSVGEAGQTRKDLERCLDETLRELFPRRIAYVQILAYPLPEDGPPTVLARSAAMLDSRFPFSAGMRQAIARRRAYTEEVGVYDFDLPNRLVTLLVDTPSGPAYVLQLGLGVFDKEQHGRIAEGLAIRPHFFFSVFPILVFGATIWGYFFMRRVFSPIHRVVGLARRISAEDLSLRIEGAEGGDEIGELIGTLNEMIARLERSFLHLRQFSSDVAHELRTPLTAISGEIEVCLRRSRDAAEYRQTLQSLSEDVQRLIAIVEDLLLLGRVEAGKELLRLTSVDLAEIVVEACERAMPHADAKGIALVVPQTEETMVAADKGLLLRLFGNLLQNAIQHTERGGRIEVSLAARADGVAVAVRDTGHGIPKEALPFVFDRFYRADASRSHATGGAGLGLAIVRKIAEAHGAAVDVESEDGVGTTFRVVLPSQDGTGEVGEKGR